MNYLGWPNVITSHSERKTGGSELGGKEHKDIRRALGDTGMHQQMSRQLLKLEDTRLDPCATSRGDSLADTLISAPWH